jgi:hypothetical protein
VAAVKLFVADGPAETYFDDDFTVNVQRLEIGPTK